MREVGRQVLQRARYVRSRAVAYALRHWNAPNPFFANMDTMGAGGDCTNFTSQCMLAGGWPPDYRGPSYDREWWYRRRSAAPFDGDNTDWWSCTWALAHSQFLYLRANGTPMENLTRAPRRARLLQLGDILYYDWDGDGTFTHSAIVTARNRSGVPYVTYRTLAPRRPVRNRHWQLRFRGEAALIVGARLSSRPVAHPTPPDWSRLQPCDRTRG